MKDLHEPCAATPSRGPARGAMPRLPPGRVGMRSRCHHTVTVTGKDAWLAASA